MASVREYRLDGRRQVTRPLGMTGDRLEVLTLLVNAPSQELDLLQAAVEAANRKIADLVPAPLAAVFGLAPREMREDHALVLDFGYSTTSVSVVRHGTVAFVGIVPVGSHHITKDIAALLQCSEAEAERLKTQQAHVKLSEVVADEAVEVVQNEGEPARKLKRRVLCEIVESRVRETLAHIRRLVESEGFSTQGVPVALLTGGGALLGGMDAAVEQELGVQRARTTWPKLTGMHARHLGVPEATVAVGLARIALEEGVEELQPARDSAGWRERLRAVWAMLPTGSK
jgi:cell division protein FtsA